MVITDNRLGGFLADFNHPVAYPHRMIGITGMVLGIFLTIMHTSIFPICILGIPGALAIFSRVDGAVIPAGLFNIFAILYYIVKVLIFGLYPGANVVADPIQVDLRLE